MHLVNGIVFEMQFKRIVQSFSENIVVSDLQMFAVLKRSTWTLDLVKQRSVCTCVCVCDLLVLCALGAFTVFIYLCLMVVGMS